MADGATAGGGDAGTTPAIERLSLCLLAAVLEVDKEEAAVARRVEKRLARDGGISSAGGSISSTPAVASAAGRNRASALAFEYRAKALGKDAVSEEDGNGSGQVGTRLSNALQALLLETERARGGEGDGSSSDSSGADGLMTPQQSGAWKALVPRFCRVYLQRAVHVAEASRMLSTSSKWHEVLAAGAAVEKAVGGSGWDEGWAATATLVASAYVYPFAHHSEHQQGTVDRDACTATTAELKRIVTEGAEQQASDNPADCGASARPWLKAEASLHLAVLALWAGDASKAGTLLKTATSHGVAKLLSGPGADWRELALRCLVEERLGGGGAGDAAVAAAAGLRRVDAAIAAFDESFRLRGAPASQGSYADFLGNLGLARASLLLKLGRLEEARSAVDVASGGALLGTAPGVGENDPQAAGGKDNSRREEFSAVSDRPPRLHSRALCVASEIDLAEGERERAKEKLRQVLDVDPGSADALSRLGWLLLGVDGGKGGKGVRGSARRRREDIEAARPLLERAVSEEPGCSSHAFRLAR